MSFIQPCFIRKNTPELRKMLEDMGIYEHPSGRATEKCLFVNRGFYSSLPIGYTEEIERAINCGTNEDLFLALAALRDDNDKNQWFTDGGKWVFCPLDNVGVYWSLCPGILFRLDTGHKASVAELIEHFSDKDYKERYERICDSEQFKETHKSLGENIKIE